MNKLKHYLFLLMILTGSTVMAQESGYTLQQALDYALKNNPDLQNAEIDVQIARKKVTQTASIGLPQVSAQFDYLGNPQIPTTVVPNFIDPTGPPLKFQMGISHTATAKINANWLILDGTYFLGLKAASQYVNLASYSRASTEAQTRVNVSKAYYLALIAEESLQLMDTNIATLERTFKDVKAMYQSGFAEKLDFQRLELQLSNLQVMRAKMVDQKEMAYRLLKFQMGMDVNAPIVLNDNLKSMLEKVSRPDSTSKVDYNNRPEYKVVNQSLVLNELNVRRYQVSYLPSLTGFVSHQQNTFATKGNFGDLGSTFYPGTTWGLSLHVPIFNGFQKQSLMQQAKLETIRSQNQLTGLGRAIENDVFMARANYYRSLETLEIQKKNFEMANDIYRITETKFKEGVGSTLEITNANRDVKDAETLYLNAIYDLLVAEVDYNRAMGQINNK